MGQSRKAKGKEVDCGEDDRRRRDDDSSDNSDSGDDEQARMIQQLLAKALKKKKSKKSKKRPRNDEDEDEDAAKDDNDSEVARLRKTNEETMAELSRMRAAIARMEQREANASTGALGSSSNAAHDHAPAPGMPTYMGLPEDSKASKDRPNDQRWYDIRAIVRDLMARAGIDITVSWKLQDKTKLGALYSLIRKRLPEFDPFANNWAAEYIVQESFNHKRGHRMSARRWRQADEDLQPIVPGPASSSESSSSESDETPLPLPHRQSEPAPAPATQSPSHVSRSTFQEQDTSAAPAADNDTLNPAPIPASNPAVRPRPRPRARPPPPSPE
ncbi:hypothetical protein BDV93DRAFT_559953 [Ceratobasidium sp. AG-I]|nr:hypothetical protein BDV93DRAFT_559953 [Ceratobasidium sp. AG-I]